MARLVLALVFCFASAFFNYVDAAQLRTRGLSVWVQDMEQYAVDAGISLEVAREALGGFVPNERVIELDRRQPEGSVSFAAYKRNVITAARIRKGASLMQRYEKELSLAERKTGVPPHIVVALWGIESSFGQNTGGFNTINSLATLAYEGRRASFFQSELIAAMRILERNRIAADALSGSWAGAMGQCQFMPSTYLKYAVDGDADGMADIWDNPADVIASIANYLMAEGWDGNLTWGRAVNARRVSVAEIGEMKSLEDWSNAGVVNTDGTHLPRRDLFATLIRVGGEDFLVYGNFDAIMRWNKSKYFALSVGILADRIRGYYEED